MQLGERFMIMNNNSNRMEERVGEKWQVKQCFWQINLDKNDKRSPYNDFQLTKGLNFLLMNYFKIIYVIHSTLY